VGGSLGTSQDNMKVVHCAKQAKGELVDRLGIFRPADPCQLLKAMVMMTNQLLTTTSQSLEWLPMSRVDSQVLVIQLGNPIQ
jgi:hypothetical protein